MEFSVRADVEARLELDGGSLLVYASRQLVDLLDA